MSHRHVLQWITTNPEVIFGFLLGWYCAIWVERSRRSRLSFFVSVTSLGFLCWKRADLVKKYFFGGKGAFLLFLYVAIGLARGFSGFLAYSRKKKSDKNGELLNWVFFHPILLMSLYTFIMGLDFYDGM